ncbi:hypothetical protein ACOACO_17225 [Nocardioides sp. CPCC 205120]|uniref:arsenate reductase/protein-tyrosine-phosphatase family protein n=1 Tax=Nocardioides sp. CPCC 205120 TaxID=3406462 RepID=UPI003B5017AB
MHILVACVGNICRSPLAERLLARELAPEVAAGTVTLGSVGVGAQDGWEMHALAAAELARLGGDPAGFRSRRATADLLGAADLVLAATRDVRTATVATAPAVLHRAFTLRELAALEAEVGEPAPADGVRRVVRSLSGRRVAVAQQDLDVPDPMGRDAGVHAAVADQLAATVPPVATLVRRVLRAGGTA